VSSFVVLAEAQRKQRATIEGVTVSKSKRWIIRRTVREGLWSNVREQGERKFYLLLRNENLPQRSSFGVLHGSFYRSECNPPLTAL